MELYLQHVADQQAANHRGQVRINANHYQLQQDPTARPWMSPEQFDELITWPGDRPIFPKEAAAQDHPDVVDDDGDSDEDMAQLVDDII